MKKKDLTGMRFGSLLVIGFDQIKYEEDKVKKLEGKLKRMRRYYICKCDLCGKTVSVRGENLMSGNTKGCGCDMYKKSGKTRTERHLNNYIFDEELNCYRGYANNTGSEFLISSESYDSVQKHCWYENKNGYFLTRLSKTEQVMLHRYVLWGEESTNHQEQVDHINRKPFDCRLSNLRACSPRENARNKSISSRNSSGVVGVSWSNQFHKWRSYISIDGICRSLGYFIDKNEAIAARKSAEQKYYGDFAPV